MLAETQSYDSGLHGVRKALLRRNVRQVFVEFTFGREGSRSLAIIEEIQRKPGQRLQSRVDGFGDRHLRNHSVHHAPRALAPPRPRIKREKGIQGFSLLRDSVPLRGTVGSDEFKSR